MNLGKFAVQAIREWNPLGPEAYRRRDRNKAYRKARRKKKRGEALSDQELEILETPEVTMLQGKKTYLGIATAAVGLVLGWVGVGDEEATALSSQVVAALDQILTIGGLLFAAYGRAKAKPAG